MKLSNLPDWKNCTLLVFISACLFVGCDTTETPRGAQNSLYISPSAHDFSQNPELLQRIYDSPHGYFRFINILFSNEVCNRFSGMLRGTPSFNLHGDAHIEQYAVTDLGRGLTDFDDSSTGPAVIDLMRIGVSLHLACRQQNWREEAQSLFDKFLEGYRAALKDPTLRPPEPVLAQRVRTKFKVDRKKYFKWVSSIMQALPAGEKEKVVEAMAPYFAAMYAEHSELSNNFFDVVDVGYLRMGIGSALDLKYLLRIRGSSANPEDDLVLEVKQVRNLTGIGCITTAQDADPFRVLLGQARIAYEPYNYLGYIRHEGATFWVHAWVDNYKELEIGKTTQSIEEMAEVAYDVGVQLGRGHTNQIAAPLDVQLRREQLSLLASTEAQIKKMCLELTDEVVAAWELFCDEVRKDWD